MIVYEVIEFKVTVVCAHLANDVGNWHGASAKACTHKPWRVRIDWASTVMAYSNRPTTGDIGQGLQEKPWCVRIWQTTSANNMQHACMYQPWPLRIGWSTSVVTCAHRPTRHNIGRISCRM